MAQAQDNTRKPANDTELRYWLENMVWHHRFTPDEVRSATGLSETALKEALERFGINGSTRPESRDGLLVLPYPGGRHPRIGFLDGAIDPQRETKISVFTPWDPASYVVVDVPEAIWSNLGLTYLAHTHVPTIWSEREVTLAIQEWERRQDGSLKLHRTLPNQIEFGTLIFPQKDHVEMMMWLKNGTKETLTDLRVQNCVMLKGARGFNQQTGENKKVEKPFVACRNEAGDRWIITAWEPCHRPWDNPPVPCLHSDPKFPDTAPGETKWLHGWLSFYEGQDIDAEFASIGKRWTKRKPPIE